MIQLKFRYFIIVNLFLMSVGVGIVYYGISNQDQVNLPLLEAIGIGLMAAGVVNILDRSFSVDPPKAPPTPPPPPGVKEKVVLAAYQRKETPKEILDLKFSSSKVDIIGVTLNHALDEIIHDRGQLIIDHLLFHNLQLRLFMVHPNSPYLLQRAIEDNDDHAKLVIRQQESVKKCVIFYQQLCKQYDQARHKKTLDTRFTGSLQIKLLDFCPYISIYRINDDQIYWGLYTSGKTGLSLPLFLTTTERDPVLHAHLHEHIHGLLAKDKKYPELVRMTNVGAPVVDNDVLISVGLPPVEIH